MKLILNLILKYEIHAVFILVVIFQVSFFLLYVTKIERIINKNTINKTIRMYLNGTKKMFSWFKLLGKYKKIALISLAIFNILILLSLFIVFILVGDYVKSIVFMIFIIMFTVVLFLIMVPMIRSFQIYLDIADKNKILEPVILVLLETTFNMIIIIPDERSKILSSISGIVNLLVIGVQFYSIRMTLSRKYICRIPKLRRVKTLFSNVIYWIFNLQLSLYSFLYYVNVVFPHAIRFGNKGHDAGRLDLLYFVSTYFSSFGSGSVTFGNYFGSIVLIFTAIVEFGFLVIIINAFLLSYQNN